MPGFNPTNYTEVKDRLPLFWEACPNGRIVTEIYAMTDDWSRVIIKASVYQHRDDPEPTTTGFAEETQTTGGGGANRYSHIENCETSAIGRALANYRFPGSGPRPSREEMTKVQRAEQSATSRPAPRQEPRPLRPSAPAAEATAEQVEAVRATLAQNDERETPEGALAWLATAANHTEQHEAHRRCRAFAEQGMISKADVAKAFNESSDRLRQSA